jgi:hypothetical protein
MAQSSIATAADYADAMLTARRAKNWLVLLLMLMLLGQVALFVVLRHWPDLTTNFKQAFLFKYLVAVTDFLGIALALVLSMVLLLIVGIMLVGRLIGVARVTSAYICCLVLIALLFPWQSILSNPRLPEAQGSPSTLTITNGNSMVPATLPTAAGTITTAPLLPNEDFKVPGVLYTWGEITHPYYGATFQTTDWRKATLHWARYVGFPVLALIILLVLQVRSSRGLKMALGEGEADLDVLSGHASQ